LPSSVVKSSMDIARRSPDDFVAFLILRVVNEAARRLTITASTGGLDLNNVSDFIDF